MTMSRNPAGTILDWEEVAGIMAPENNFQVDAVDVDGDDGELKTVRFDPPYRIEVGCGYAFWVGEDGTPQLWQIEQREDYGIYWVREAERMQVLVH